MKIGVLRALLLMLNVTMALGIAYEWQKGQAQLARINHQKGLVVEAPSLNTLQDVPATVDTTAIIEGAIFHQSRNFVHPVAPSSILSPPPYLLTGVMGMTKEKRMALVRNSNDKTTRTIHVGDDLDGWRVMNIDFTHVTIEHGQQLAEIHTSDTSSVSGMISATAPATQRSQNGVHVLRAGNAGTNTRDPVAVKLYRPPPP